ncbi:MAG: sugar phosphate isomerase/epimerase [Clostridia bacterium]|nr:sugar phosphate isomerase/epimerase [Clostridia bacterium]
MKKTLLQVQPQYANKNEWTALSEREGLFFECIEPVFNPEQIDLSNPDPQLRWYREGGRTAAVHGAFIDVNIASGDGAFRALSQRRCHESCRLAQHLGAEYVVFHSSCFPFLRGAYLESWADRCADFYMELARQYGLAIRVENSQDVDPAPLERLMRSVQGADVSVCLDIGHAAYSRAPVREWFDRLGDHISYLHLSDNMGLFDDHLPIGEGGIDWAEADGLWRQLKRPAPVTLEVGSIRNVEKSLSYLRDHGLFGLEG